MSQLDPIALHTLRLHHVIDADTLRRLAREDEIRIKSGERIVLGLGIVGALLVIVLFTTALYTGDIRTAPYAKSAGLAYLCSFPWIIWFGVKRRRFGKIAGVMLRYARCPHCGYHMRGLPVDATDGATICPECGCAWILGGQQDGASDAPVL